MAVIYNCFEAKLIVLYQFGVDNTSSKVEVKEYERMVQKE